MYDMSLVILNAFKFAYIMDEWANGQPVEIQPWHYKVRKHASTQAALVGTDPIL